MRIQRNDRSQQSLHSRARLAFVGCAAAVWMAGCAAPPGPEVPGPAAASGSPATTQPAIGPRSAAAAASAPSSNRARAPAAHVPAPRTGPGGSTYGARHGGLVIDVEGVRIELDAQPEHLTLYLSENDQALSTQGATAHLTLLNGVNITDAELEPSPERDRLTVRGDFKLVRGTRVVVRVSLPDGRRLTTRFFIII